MPQNVATNVAANVVADEGATKVVVMDEAGSELAVLQSSSGTDTASINPTHSNGRSSNRSQPHASTALQDMFLNGLRRENIDVVVYFCDGSQERGIVRAFDTFTLLLENRGSGKSQLIYKHAIARIFPVRTPSTITNRAHR